MDAADADVLMIGCGDLGSRIGLRLAERGHRVLALRRRGDLVPAPLRGLSVDLTRESPDLPALQLRHLVVALTARPRSEDAYRATYVDGMRRALDALEATGQRPERAVLVSSTGVHGDVPDGTLVDESLVPSPADGPARVLLEAEELFAERVPGGTVLRCSGLYDGARSRLVDKVAAGDLDDPGRWTNRIHRDDAAAAAVHLLTRPEAPEPVYLGNDDEPAPLGDVAGEIARVLGVTPPPPADATRAHGKRISNARLRATGWVPTYPTYREGYAGVAASSGTG
ncbi:NAD(P)-dependent oxidoreductase [Nocardioides sp. OK12]|uniref:NAD(P)H-binding protein n=1 Tax=Nocardioides sp. OK12 TaxID=2758661 RepID=UPI0021C3E4B0|nr:NAD(P)H-binding protein [Nocardioides sp. OK12]GHJ59746.1 NAD(P)-dependent oxidoreductase [Nocardioides sp. OK12]